MADKFTIVTVYIPPGKTLDDAIVHSYGEFPTRSKAKTALKNQIIEQEYNFGPTPEGGQILRRVCTVIM
jgi:hypothetical protein